MRTGVSAGWDGTGAWCRRERVPSAARNARYRRCNRPPARLELGRGRGGAGGPRLASPRSESSPLKLFLSFELTTRLNLWREMF